MTDNEQILKDGILEALELLKEYGKAVLIQQGHVATNDGINSLDTQIDTLGNEFMGSVTGRKYLLAQDTGIQANRYATKKTDGRLLQNIIDWIEAKGITIAMESKGGKPLSPSKQTSKNLAFAIIKTHKIVGMHSHFGQRDQSRQNWIGQTISEKNSEVFKIIEASGFKYFDSLIKSMVNEAQRNNL
jgi:hypothetical protein